MDTDIKTVTSLSALAEYARCDEEGNNIKSTYSKKKYTQEPLISGYNIKTFNGESILGSGDLKVDTAAKIQINALTADTTQSIDPFKMYDFGTISSSITITFGTVGTIIGYCKEYSFRFVAGTDCSITLPSDCKFLDGNNITTFVEGHTYKYDIIDNLVTIKEFY